MRQIVVIGFKDSGKSSVVNWLLGYRVAPAGTRVRTTYMYGDIDEVEIEISFRGVVETEKHVVRLAQLHRYLQMFSGDQVTDGYVRNLMSIRVTLPKRYMINGEMVVTEFSENASQVFDAHILDKATHIISTYRPGKKALKYELSAEDRRIYRVMTCLHDIKWNDLVCLFEGRPERSGFLNVGYRGEFKGAALRWVKAQEERLKRWLGGVMRY